MKERLEMQLKAVMVKMEVVKYYVMDQYEHTFMDKNFTDVMTERFLRTG